MTVSVNTYKKLKEIGFKTLECTCGGFPDCICDIVDRPPTIYFVSKWFRDNHNIRIFPSQKIAGDFGYEIYIPTGDVGKPFSRFSPYTKHYSSFENALEMGIEQAIKLFNKEDGEII